MSGKGCIFRVRTLELSGGLASVPNSYMHNCSVQRQLESSPKVLCDALSPAQELSMASITPRKFPRSFLAVTNPTNPSFETHFPRKLVLHLPFGFWPQPYTTLFHPQLGFPILPTKSGMESKCPRPNVLHGLNSVPLGMGDCGDPFLSLNGAVTTSLLDHL